MKLKLLFLVICCQALFAQGESQNAPNTPHVSTSTASTRRVVAVKVVHVKGDAAVIAALAGRASGVDYQVSSPLKAIVLKGEPSDVANVERTIQELDSLSSASSTASGVRNIELTIHVIAGSSEPIAGFEEVSGDALAPVLKQLRAIFSYKHYELLSTIFMRSAQNTGGTAEGGIRPIQTTDLSLSPVTYRLSYESVGASTEAIPLIHVVMLQFGASIPYVIGPKESKQFQNFHIGISSNLDLLEGQKVVVGTSNVPEGNTSVFLVLSARLVQ
jgi:hypothetical protein